MKVGSNNQLYCSYKIHAEDPRHLKHYECHCIIQQKQMAFILHVYSRIEKVSSKTCLYGTLTNFGEMTSFFSGETLLARASGR